MVRSCLEIDPLARPQSVFALQKVLQVATRPTPQPPPPPQGMMDKLGGGLRGLVGRLAHRQALQAGPESV
jgi:hypothetical protein